MKTQLLALSLLTTGCSDLALQASDWEGESADTGFGLDSGQLVDDTGQASYFVMNGSLHIMDGEFQNEDTLLEITFLDEEGEELCSASPEIAELEQLIPEVSTDEPTESDLLLWMHVRFTDGVPMDCSFQHPAEFFFGIGEMNSLLLPALSASGFGEQESNLFGLYYQRDETSSLFVYGVAGTDENFEGTSSLPDQALPEGDITLLGLHYLPL